MLKNKSITEKKRNIEEAVDRRDSELRQLALNIHAHPELGYQEYKASDWLSTLLEKEGFAVK
ncbi:hypothetical protein P5F80_07755 [Shouchella clausii]|nr:hypothetical protein [Shouchella clausii]MED4158783.1 hypothetical protein [Shouchella clausii]MED4176420.1 hypothetical protein [Shouchella clausii]